MKKSYIKCPYCGDEITISGITMHVKVKHPDKFEEFKLKFAELKKTAVVKESGTRTPVKSGEEPPKVEEKPEDKDKKPPEPPKPKEEPRGDDKPPQGKSFLREFDEYLDSPEF